MPPFTHHRPAPAEPEGAPAMIGIRVRTVGRRTVLAVAGEVDLASVDALRSAIRAALDSGTAELWIDLGETEFMDSTGLHALVDAGHDVRRLRRRLAIVCPPGPVRRLFDLTGLATLLPVHDDIVSAAHA